VAAVTGTNAKAAVEKKAAAGATCEQEEVSA
jgi:hypothetical protein